MFKKLDLENIQTERAHHMKGKKTRRIVYKILSYKRKKVLQKANKLKGKDILSKNCCRGTKRSSNKK